MITLVCSYLSLLISCADIRGYVHDYYIEYQIMTPEIAHRYIIPAAESLFPDSQRFHNPRAHAMILAIGIVESDFKARRQRLSYKRPWWKFLDSPAVSYWQFETPGIAEVLRHPASRSKALHALEVFGLPEDIPTIREALVYNDVLAAIWVRLALWRHPFPLPERFMPDEAYYQYLQLWRPGKPPLNQKWRDAYSEAWHIVSGPA